MNSTPALPSPAEARAQTSPFTGVMKLVNHFVAFHGDNRGHIRFISEHPEKDLKIAAFAAMSFAQAHNIPFAYKLQETTQPILTVICDGNTWFPAELHPERIALLQSFNLSASVSVPLGGSQQVAIQWAKSIAEIRGADCVPSIGISLYKPPAADGKKSENEP